MATHRIDVTQVGLNEFKIDPPLHVKGGDVIYVSSVSDGFDQNFPMNRDARLTKVHFGRRPIAEIGELNYP